MLLQEGLYYFPIVFSVDDLGYLDGVIISFAYEMNDCLNFAALLIVEYPFYVKSPKVFAFYMINNFVITLK